MVQIQNGILFNCKKKNEVTTFSGKWIDVEKSVLSEVTDPER